MRCCPTVAATVRMWHSRQTAGSGSQAAPAWGPGSARHCWQLRAQPLHQGAAGCAGCAGCPCRCPCVPWQAWCSSEAQHQVPAAVPGQCAKTGHLRAMVAQGPCLEIFRAECALWHATQGANKYHEAPTRQEEHCHTWRCTLTAAMWQSKAQCLQGSHSRPPPPCYSLHPVMHDDTS